MVYARLDGMTGILIHCCKGNDVLGNIDVVPLFRLSVLAR